MLEFPLDFSAGKSTCVGRIILKGNDYEPEVMHLLLWLLHDAQRGLFLDIGSNIGFFPLVLGKYIQLTAGNVAIFAHEPLPDLQEISMELQKTNSVSYRLASTAVSDYSGNADFFVSMASDASNSLVQGFRQAKDVIKVTVDTLDNLYLDKIIAEKYTDVVLMIDVETAEPAVLRGARKTIGQIRPFVICEILAGRTENEISKIMKDNDYVNYRFDGERWVLESELWGDRTYKHRDWFFVPRERAGDFGEGFAVDPKCIVRITGS